jgi:hypothetical protein
MFMGESASTATQPPKLFVIGSYFTPAGKSSKKAGKRFFRPSH